MYLEFTLPKGSGGQDAAYVNNLLNQHLHDWADKYHIAYNKKIHKFTVRITFDDDKHYALFALTWSPQVDLFRNYLLDFRFIEPMSRV